MSQTERLFPVDAYPVYSPPHLMIANKLGYERNVRIYDCDYYEVHTKNKEQTVYTPISEDCIPSYYGKDRDDWRPQTVNKNVFKGFLAGLPTLVFEESDLEPSVHLFSFYHDIYGDSTVIPMRDIYVIKKYHPTHRKLLVHLHNALEFGPEGSGLNVPVLQDAKTGEYIHRPADAEDINRVLGSLALPTQVVYKAPSK